MKIDRMLTISAMHIKERTLEFLSEEAIYEEAQCAVGKLLTFLRVYHKGDDGFFIIIDENALKTVLANGTVIPHDLKEALEFAIKMDCSVLCIDRDTEAIQSLPTYD